MSSARIVRLLAALFAAAAFPALAQFRVEVSGVGLTQVPVSIPGFSGEELLPQKLSAIVQADLERSGIFRGLEAPGVKLDEKTLPELTSWRQRGADALVGGSVSKLADGRFDVRFRLWDIVKGADLGGQSYAVVTGDLRRAAHQVSDFVYQKLTGEKGIFTTRIAYVTKANHNYDLWIADADGENAQSALSSPESIISPAWSPDGRDIVYVSFESRKPVVYTHNLASGRRRLIANFRGSNSAPAWSPDGRSLAVTLSRDGGSQLFLLPPEGGEPKRLMQSDSIDTEAVFSPDSSALYFVSDRGGSPQIYRLNLSTLKPERVTFQGTYNISPAPSPDGRWLAYVSRIDGAFKLLVMELNTGTVSSVTDTVADERPSFAPNSRLIVYATQANGKEALMITSPDGRFRAKLSDDVRDIREPAWGPFIN